MKKFLCFVLTLCAAFSFTACGVAEAEYLVDWEYITGVPADFPKLCDKISESYESFDATSNNVFIGWNVLDEASFNEYTAKIERWSGVKFGETEDGTKSLELIQDDKALTVTVRYNAKAKGRKNSDGRYDCQAIIEVVTKTTRASKYTPIKWDLLFLLPEGFPKLCDSVTTVDEIYGENENRFALYWNILDSESYDSYISQIEKWAGTTFGDVAADGTRSLSAEINGKEITVNAAYNGKGTGKYLQGNKYDSQARIEIVTPAK